jgi:hypothetical protein
MGRHGGSGEHGARAAPDAHPHLCLSTHTPRRRAHATSGREWGGVRLHGGLLLERQGCLLCLGLLQLKLHVRIQQRFSRLELCVRPAYVRKVPGRHTHMYKRTDTERFYLTRLHKQGAACAATPDMGQGVLSLSASLCVCASLSQCAARTWPQGQRRRRLFFAVPRRAGLHHRGHVDKGTVF